MTPTQLLIREEILRRLTAGESLRAICRDEGFPDESTVRTWARDDTEFGPHYTRARALGYERLAEELLDAARGVRIGVVKKVVRKVTEVDGEPIEGSEDVEETETTSDAVDRARLHVDTLKWTLAKMLPKVYGDKLAVEQSGPDGGPIVTQAIVVPEHDPIAASQAYQQFVDPK